LNFLSAEELSPFVNTSERIQSMTEPHPNIRPLRAAGLWRWVLALTIGSIIPLLIGCAAATGRGASEAQISAGRLQGKAQSGVLRFLGIPFAAAPVDSLRFRAPQPAAAWAGTRDAIEFGSKCAQLKIDAGAIGILGEEDCLYLNVYRPNDDSRNRPVLFWIHGGGRRVGDGRRDVSAFVRETGSVVVSIQYRLDHLAFFAHPALTAEDPTRLASGNYGFEDAIAALHWVRDEIGAFGGDRDRITIAGLSGGGTMVCGLLVSPRAAGLFHRAIIQSGGGCWFPTQPIALAEAWGTRAAEKLGCSNASSVPDCLRKTPVAEFYALGSTVENPFTPGSVEWSASQPILGGRSGHLVDGSLFPRSWPDAFSIGAFHQVPLMIGTTEHEGRRVYGELMYQMGAREITGNEYVQALMGLLGSHRLASRAAERFPVGDPAMESFTDFATDAHYTCPHAELAAAAARFAPTWLYQFKVAGPRKSDRIELGAYHGADTELLFGDGFANGWTPEQVRASERLREYVGRFMGAGDPNQPGSTSWPTYASTAPQQHLELNDDPRAATGLRERACRFLREIQWEMLPTH